MITTRHNGVSRGRMCALLIALCCIVSLSAGCFKTTITPQPYPRTGQTQPTGPGTPTTLLDAAEEALAAGDMAKAELLSSQLTRRPGVSGVEAARAWRVLALSAQANRHPFLSISALDRWRADQPQAEEGKEWQEAWTGALRAVPPFDATTKAQGIIGDEKRPWSLRVGMLYFLASRQWEGGALAPGLTALETFYSAHEDKNQRAVMEQQLLQELHSVDAALLGKLSGHVTPENTKRYPYALVALEEAHRMMGQSAQRDAAKEQIAQLRNGTQLVSPAIFDLGPAPVPQVTSVIPISGHGVALALPLSGQAGLIGSKIARGAKIAQKEFAAAGHNFGVAIIDTEQPAWLDQVASLPDTVTVVGGMLRMQEYTAAKSKGLAAKRSLFAFLPNIGEDEGSLAWRFFPSVNDQMDALFRLTQSLNVSSYAMLLPDDSFGQRIGDIFEKQAVAKGGSIVARSKYPPNEQGSWNKLVGAFLGTNKHANRAPSVSFRAIFLPDSWKNMELLVPNLFYFRETRQLLLGTSLWEQGLSGQAHIDARYYDLAVFPGAWRSKDLPPAGQRLQQAVVAAGQEEADFWVGLGYDFVRFAATLDIKPGWNAGAVNSLLMGHKGIPWSMAPIRWSGTGKAAQELYLFTPDNTGFSPVDMETLRQRFEKAWR